MIVPKSLDGGSNFLISCTCPLADGIGLAPRKQHWSRRAPNSDHTIVDLLLDATFPQITLTMADSNTNAPITPAAVRPNRPMSEALLNEKVRFAHGVLQEKEYRRGRGVWTRPKDNG